MVIGHHFPDILGRTCILGCDPDILDCTRVVMRTDPVRLLCTYTYLSADWHPISYLERKIMTGHKRADRDRFRGSKTRAIRF